MENIIKKNVFGLFNNITDKQLEEYRHKNGLTRKKEFEAMNEILRDAEKHLENGEYIAHVRLLAVLTQYIEDYILIEKK